MATELPAIVIPEEPDAPNAVSLDTTTPEDNSVSLPTPGVTEQPLPPDLANQRAGKTEQGLGEVLNKTKKDIYQDFIDGKEQAVRRQAASTLDYQKAMARQQAIQDLSAKKGGPLDAAEVQQVMDPFSPRNTATDPNLVIERAYAQKYISTLNTAAGYMSDSNPLTDAQREIPQQAQDTLDEGSELLTKNQYILHRMQNTQQNVVGNQSWAGYLADQGKSLFQPYVEYKERTAGPAGPVAGIGLGSNLDEQHYALYRMPLPDFKATFDAKMDALEKDNPSLAVSYAQSLLGQNTFDTILNNTFTALAVPDMVAGVKVVKKVLTYNQIRKTAKDIVSAAAKDPEGTPANATAASGDVTGAAVKNTAQDVTEAATGNGNPLRVLDRTLLTTWKDDAANYASNPGTYLSREAYTRIADGWVKDGEELLNRITTMNRVERQPLAVTSEDVISAYKDKIKQDYKGPSASFLDVEGPILEDASHTYWYKSKLGNYDGSLFSDAETATGFANQLGLTDIKLVGKEADKLYISEAAAKKIESVESKNTVTFKTSKGSSYEVVGNATTRNKAPRPEHPGEQGPQPKSEKTYYVSKDQLNGLAEFQAQGGPKVALAETKDGRIGVKYLEGKDAGKFEKRTVTSFETEPKKGLHPVEVWKDGTRAHFGNAITEVTQNTRATKFMVDNGIEVVPSTKPQPGMVPFNIKTGKFEPTLTTESSKIEQQGLGFYIEHLTPMKETDSVLRDTMIKTTHGELVKEATSTNSATGINQIKNSLLGWVRNSDDTLSINESAQRKAAVYAKTNVERWARELNKDMEDIKSGRVRNDPVTGEPISPFVSYPKSFLGKVLPGKKVFQEFERTLDYSRRALDEKGEPGYFFKNGAELQDHYNRNFNRDPSYLETKAYFNYVKVKEGERMMGEIAEFRNRAREGYEQHQISMKDANGNEVKSGFFDARPVNHFPGGDSFIFVNGELKGGERVQRIGRINTKMLDEMKRQVATGEAKLSEIYSPNHFPLQGYSDLANDQFIRYVFSKNVESKSLEFNHVNRRGGAHFEWDYDNYIKQADMRPQISSEGKVLEHTYLGDTTVMPIKNRRLGANIAKIWNQAQELIKQGKWEEAKPLAAKMGIEWKEFTGWYHPGRDANGKAVRPRLNVNEPIVVVHRDKRIGDIDNTLQERYKGTFKDRSREGSANNFKVAYNTERSTYDFRTINDIGSQGNPIYAHQPADFVDPLTTMNRSLNRAINSTFMDDYKLHAIEHWLREVEPYLDAKGGVKEVRSSPFAWFNKPEWKADLDLTKKMNFMSNRYKIQSFVGIPSKFDTWVHSFTEHLADTSYGKYGPEAGRNLGQKALSIAPIWVLQHLTNPVDFIRGVAFNFKLGLFNPAQFLVQAQTHSLIWALEPRHGTVGTYGMMLHGWSRVNKNPAILASLDNYYTKLSGFGSRAKPGEFIEAMTELERSGFEHVAGEYANLSKAYLPTTNFIQNDLNKGLRLGQTPFRLGEQSTRITAWYTAFREFREANPTTPLTNIERNKILQKADLLTVNMSRASGSALNHGVFSLSSQFLSYQIKLAELFWSKRIGETAAQRTMARARIITGFAALYGLPNAVGVTGAPIMDNLREHFMDDLGYIPGEKWLSTMINEGFPVWSWGMITGKGDLQAGNIENGGDRYGSQGWQNVKQGLRGDIPWYQAIGGAGVSVVSNFMSAAVDPYYQAAISWARGDTGDQRYTIREADLVEPLKEISTYSQASKWWTAIQTGKWLSKNESTVTNVSPLRATLLGLTGMSPQDADDAFLKNQMIKGEVDAQKVALRDFIKDWRRGIEAKANGDLEQGNAYHRNAMSRLTAVGYPYEKILSAMAIASKGWETTIDAANERLIRDGDQSKREQRLDQYKRELNLKDKRQ